MTERSPAARATRRRAAAARRHACSSASMRAHALGQVRRQRKLAAVVAGDHGIARRGAGDEALRSRCMPSKRSTSPANTKVSPGVSCSMKYSSTSPSTRPPISGACVAGLVPARRPTRRTLIIGASTMVPTFRR